MLRLSEKPYRSFRPTGASMLVRIAFNCSSTELGFQVPNKLRSIGLWLYASSAVVCIY